MNKAEFVLNLLTNIRKMLDIVEMEPEEIFCAWGEAVEEKGESDIDDEVMNEVGLIASKAQKIAYDAVAVLTMMGYDTTPRI